MSTIYRKTPKGQTEIETRALRLVPRLRQALILIDGRKTDLELAPLINESQAAFAKLLEDGFIEAIGIVIDAPAAPAAADETTLPLHAPSIDALRRDAVRYLNDLLGPAADSISIKLERARSMAELRPLLASAAQLVGTVRGAAAAQQFSARFLADDAG